MQFENFDKKNSILRFFKNKKSKATIIEKYFVATNFYQN